MTSFLFLRIMLSGFAVYASAGGASAAASPAAPAPQPAFLEQFFPFILIGLVFYFLLIRPQKKRIQRQESFLSRLKKGDEVVTSGGILGKIEGLTEQFVTLEVSDKTRIRVLKSKVSAFVKDMDAKDTKNMDAKNRARAKKDEPRPLSPYKKGFGGKSQGRLQGKLQGKARIT